MFVCLVYPLLLFAAFAQTPEETHVLEIFYNSTGGPTSWINKWDLGEPLCEQYGIRCTNSSGVELILELSLTRNSLTGTIPGEICSLTRLQHLNVENNDLYGSLPSELSQVAWSFRYLRVARNRLTGTLFSGISNLNIDTLDLGGNQLSGSIPDDIGPSTRLGYLYLSGNQFTGIITSNLQRMGRLNVLTMAGNNFSCPLTDLSYITFSDFDELKQEAGCADYGTWTIESYLNCTFEGIRPIDEVHCLEDDLRVIEEVNCEYAPKPRQEDCTGVWEASGWGECVDGFQQRSSECKSAEDHQLMGDIICLVDEPRPVDQRVCYDTWLTTQIIYIICGLSVFILLVAAFACYKHRKYKTLQQKKNIIPFKDLSKITKLAEGNFGVIYKAVWASPKGNKDVVCKAPKLDPSKSDWLELTVLNNVKPHKNVLSLYGICTDFQSEFGERISIVCPFYSQGSVEEFLMYLQEPLSREDKCTLALGMTKGLQHVHKSGFIHRDVAPRNYLLHKGNAEAILSDFGLSRPIGESEVYKVIGPTQVPAVNAPETLSKKMSTTKSDIWQLGVSFWWLHTAGTGDHLIPFGDVDNSKFLSFLRTHKREVPLNFRDDSPFSNLIKLCCSFSPEDRPTTEQIIMDLTLLRGDETYEIGAEEQKIAYSLASVLSDDNLATHSARSSADFHGGYLSFAPGGSTKSGTTITAVDHHSSTSDMSDWKSSPQSTLNFISSIGTGKPESTASISNETLVTHEACETTEQTSTTEDSTSEPLLNVVEYP